MKRLVALVLVGFFFACSGEEIKEQVVETALERGNGNGNGKGKKDKVLLLEPSQNSNLQQIAVVTNVMLDPVTYTGELPTSDNGGLVDWDNDGLIDDLVTLETRCFFPRTFAKVVVYIDGTNPIAVNYSIRHNAILLGFLDFDNDGDMDIIWQGGNHWAYNQGETYSQYNVGENVLAEEPTPLADIVASLEISQSVNNPDFVRWNIEGYQAYGFHVKWRELGESAWREQTSTYGEFGIQVNNFTPNTTYEIGFSNLADGCEDVVIQITL